VQISRLPHKQAKAVTEETFFHYSVILIALLPKYCWRKLMLLYHPVRIYGCSLF
jgi:hypothetical protein